MPNDSISTTLADTIKTVLHLLLIFLLDIFSSICLNISCLIQNNHIENVGSIIAILISPSPLNLTVYGMLIGPSTAQAVQWLTHITTFSSCRTFSSPIFGSSILASIMVFSSHSSGTTTFGPNSSSGTVTFDL